MNNKPTILFDIDGTLIRTNNAGLSAIDQTLLEMFGIENQFQVTLAGRTDFAIIGDIFQANQIDFEEHYSAFSINYHRRLEKTLDRVEGEVLPGVLTLLKTLHAEKYPLGIITGNAKVPAWHKLNRFELDSFFHFGGYGDDSGNRNVVAAQAVQDAERHLEEDFQIGSCWVIGDTPADVICAQSIGAKSVAVLTGGHGRDDFADFDVDQVIDDLTHVTVDSFR